MDFTKKENQKNLWELLGFEFDDEFPIFTYPDGSVKSTQPLLTLDNLFKWGVPKLNPKTLMMETFIEDGNVEYSWCILSEKQSGGIWESSSKDSALALAQAIYKALELKEEIE